MAQRSKRRVKQRAKAHRKHVKAGRRVRKHSKRKIGYGTRARRRKTSTRKK